MQSFATFFKPQHTHTNLCKYDHLQQFSNPNTHIQTSVNTIICFCNKSQALTKQHIKTSTHHLHFNTATHTNIYTSLAIEHSNTYKHLHITCNFTQQQIQTSTHHLQMNTETHTISTHHLQLNTTTHTNNYTSLAI